jgi:amino acid permease
MKMSMIRFFNQFSISEIFFAMMPHLFSVIVFIYVVSFSNSIYHLLRRTLVLSVRYSASPSFSLSDREGAVLWYETKPQILHFNFSLEPIK